MASKLEWMNMSMHILYARKHRSGVFGNPTLSTPFSQKAADTQVTALQLLVSLWFQKGKFTRVRVEYESEWNIRPYFHQRNSEIDHIPRQARGN